jgi:glycyl-tRNA synthetase beta chain
VQRPGVAQEAFDYIAERLRGLFTERADGTTVEMIDAVLAARPPASPLDADERLQALREFLRLPDAPVLTALNKRIGNILRKAPLPADARVEAASLTEAAERRLHGALIEAERRIGAAAAERRYGASLAGLVDLALPVGDFFEHIMVMDEHVERRTNRLALLRDAQRLFRTVADLSRLPG